MFKMYAINQFMFFFSFSRVHRAKVVSALSEGKKVAWHISIFLFDWRMNLRVCINQFVFTFSLFAHQSKVRFYRYGFWIVYVFTYVSCWGIVSFGSVFFRLLLPVLIAATFFFFFKSLYIIILSTLTRKDTQKRNISFLFVIFTFAIFFPSMNKLLSPFQIYTTLFVLLFFVWFFFLSLVSLLFPTLHFFLLLFVLFTNRFTRYCTTI